MTIEVTNWFGENNTREYKATLNDGSVHNIVLKLEEISEVILKKFIEPNVKINNSVLDTIHYIEKTLIMKKLNIAE